MDLDLRNVDIGNLVMKTNYILFLMLFTVATHAAEEGSVTPGTWPDTLVHVDGEGDTKQILFSSRNIVVDKSDVVTPIIKVDKNTVIYAPAGAKVRAKPKVYTHPELSDEVQRFYTEGVGNYAFWATLIGVAAALQ